MTQNAFRSLFTLAALMALSGCQSGPRWAFWKHDAAPDASAVARSAEPKLPSTQSTPQAVAIAGLTPAAPPSSTNLAAAATPAANSVAAGSPTAPPNLMIPVTAQTTYPSSPADALADKIATTPNTAGKTATLPTAMAAQPASASPATQSVAATPAAGPYDPKGYKPATTLASVGPDTGSGTGEVDRYGMNSASPYSAPAATSIASAPPVSPSTDQYGPVSAASSLAADAPPASSTAATTSTTSATTPVATPLADRYAMPATPPSTTGFGSEPVASTASVANAALTTTTANAPATTPVAFPSSIATTAVAAGGYRPGGTSSYVYDMVAPPVEVASRPAPPTPTLPASTGTIGSSSDAWAPPAPATTPAGTRTY